MGITPKYTKDAVNNYRNKFDIIQLRLPKGTKEKLLDRMETKEINSYITNLILNDLNTSAVDQPKTEQKEIAQPVQDEKLEQKQIDPSWDDLPFH